MKKFAVSAALLMMVSLIHAQTVKVEGGLLQGIASDEVTVFKGIPYAAPPVGNLRWRAPQAVIPWDGIKVADTFGPIAWQEAQDPKGLYGKEFYSEGLPEMNEDCLYLNVWAPSGSIGDERAKLPVAMWIHGGAYSAGYGYEVTMDGTAWAKEGVILVTINYRLGVLGFLSHPDLSKEQGGVSGNYGMMDQIAALKWIHENIAGFGGDPDNITVFGQSAGAMSVKTLVASPESKGLIAKAIIQSGGGIGENKKIKTKSPSTYDKTGKKIMKSGGFTTLAQMRAASYTEIHDAIGPAVKRAILKNMLGKGSVVEKALVFSPHVDGKVMKERFDEAVYDGSVADIPYMMGSVSGDGDLLGGEDVDRFCAWRNAHSSHPAYSYRFERGLPGDDAGAFHSSELWYVFGTLDRCWRPFTEADYALSRKMVKAWTSFCKTGNPGWEKAPHVEVLDIQ